MKFKNIWVIIPAYNAAEGLPQVIREISIAFPDLKMVVVDDGSTDGTSEAAHSRKNVSLIEIPNNLGVGAAIKQGAAFALRNGAEFLVTIGADNQRDVKEISLLLEPLLKGHCDMSIGTRFMGNRQWIPFGRKWGNQFLTKMVNVLFGTTFTDVTSGFRGLNKKVAENMEELADRYPFDADLCIQAAKLNLKCVDIPVKVFYEGSYSRMRSTVLTGLHILWVIVNRRWTRT